jgi:hypothetical protein
MRWLLGLHQWERQQFVSSLLRSEPAKIGRQIFHDAGEKYVVGERKLRNFV